LEYLEFEASLKNKDYWDQMKALSELSDGHPWVNRFLESVKNKNE